MDHSARLSASALHRDKLATLGQLTAEVAHELNNPIGYIASNLRSLERDVGDLLSLISELQHAADGPAGGIERALAARDWDFLREDLPALLRETSAGAEHLVQVVADLKALSRAGAESEEVAPDACIAAAVNVLGYQFRHGVDLALDLTAGDAQSLVRSQVIQALTNLLHNACQAQDGRGAVLVRSRQAGGRTDIVIEDDGPGIDPVLAETLFEPYVTGKGPGDGTGLGLTIARQVATEHGGSLAVIAPEHLAGAAFCFTLTRWQGGA